MTCLTAHSCFQCDSKRVSPSSLPDLIAFSHCLLYTWVLQWIQVVCSGLWGEICKWLSHLARGCGLSAWYGLHIAEATTPERMASRTERWAPNYRSLLQLQDPCFPMALVVRSFVCLFVTGPHIEQAYHTCSQELPWTPDSPPSVS